ncbi:MAG: hypothetical protein EGR43_02320 [Prevotella sp.]|nr:hypothetical protein [Prevotella sp.]
MRHATCHRHWQKQLVLHSGKHMRSCQQGM